MCRTCESSAAGRRQFLKFAAGGLAAITLAGAMGEARAAEGAPTTLSPDEALAQLKSGNERYVRQPELCSVDLAQKRESVAGHQAPWATIIACADSRSPPSSSSADAGSANSSSPGTPATSSTPRRWARSNTAPRCSARRSSSSSRTRAAAR